MQKLKDYFPVTSDLYRDRDQAFKNAFLGMISDLGLTGEEDVDSDVDMDDDGEVLVIRANGKEGKGIFSCRGSNYIIDIYIDGRQTFRSAN